MNTEYGTLTIRREIATPDQHNHKVERYRMVTLATYRNIPHHECADLLEQFCNSNNVGRGDLFCTWSLILPL